MSKLNELILKTMDLGTKKNKSLRPVKLDETLQDWELQLSNNQKSKISTITKNGPLLLIFIRGTWCPFCRMHMKNLRDWVAKLQNKKATIIVVSSEPLEKSRIGYKKIAFLISLPLMSGCCSQIILV